MKLKKLFGDDHTSIIALYNDFHDPNYFKPIGVELIAGPVADTEGNPIYAQNSSRDNLLGMLGKRTTKKSNVALEKEIVT